MVRLFSSGEKSGKSILHQLEAVENTFVLLVEWNESWTRVARCMKRFVCFKLFGTKVYGVSSWNDFALAQLLCCAGEILGRCVRAMLFYTNSATYYLFSPSSCVFHNGTFRNMKEEHPPFVEYTVDEPEEFLEQTTLIRDENGDTVSLSDDFEWSIRREALLRCSLDSLSAMDLNIEPMKNSFSPFMYSSRRPSSSNSSKFLRTTSLCTGSSTPVDQRSQWSPTQSLRERSRTEQTLPSRLSRPPVPKSKARRVRKKVSKMLRDTGYVTVKMVAIPTIVVCDIIGGVVGLT